MSFNFTPPYQIALLLNRSTDGGLTWQAHGLTQISTWNGNGKSKGSNGQFPDHQSIHVDTSSSSPYYGSIYVTWAQFNGQGTHSPVYIAVSRNGGRTFSAPAAISAVTTIISMVVANGRFCAATSPCVFNDELDFVQNRCARHR